MTKAYSKNVIIILFFLINIFLFNPVSLQASGELTISSNGIIGEAFSIETLFRIEEIQLTPVNYELVITGLSSDSEEFSNILKFSWKRSRTGFFANWDLKVSSPLDILPESEIDERRDGLNYINLKRVEPIKGNLYQGVFSYDPRAGLLNVALEDKTAGEVIINIFLEMKSFTDEFYPVFGWLTTDDYQSKRGNIISSSLINFPEIRLENRYQGRGIPLALEREFRSNLMEYDKIKEDFNRKYNFEINLEDIIAISLNWPAEEIEGEIQLSLKQNQDKINLFSSKWKDGEDVHILPFAESLIFLGDFELVFEYIRENKITEFGKERIRIMAEKEIVDPGKRINIIDYISPNYVEVSSYYSHLGGHRAVDGDASTAWRIDEKEGSIEFSLGVLTEFNEIVINEYRNSIQEILIEYYDGKDWMKLYQGPKINSGKYTFKTVQGSGIRISIKTTGHGGISGIEVYNIYSSEYEKITDIDAVITPFQEEIGKSTQYVGFSGVHHLAGSNLPVWLKYYGVNGVRAWYTASRHLPLSDLNLGENVRNIDDFFLRKEEFRENMYNDPDNNGFINWDYVKFSERYETSAGVYTIDDAFNNYMNLGITPVVMLNASRISINNWRENWTRWLQIYGMVFYLAKNFDIEMYQFQNEPEGHVFREPPILTLEEYVLSLQIHSDAIRSAIEDVNKIYDKSLEPKFDAPVLAGTPLGPLGRLLMQNIRTDLAGNTVDYNIVNIFSNHRYDSRPKNYGDEILQIQEMMREESPVGETLPIIYSEFNYATGSNWNRPHVTFTNDTPEVFRNQGSTWGLSMESGVYGMYQFRFTQLPYRKVNSINYAIAIDKDPEANLALNKPVIASSEREGFPASNAVDGNYTEKSMWISANDASRPQTLEIDLLDTYNIKTIIVYTGDDIKMRDAANVVDSYKLQYWSFGQWRDIPGTSVSNNRNHGFGNSRQFILSQPIRTSKIRFYSNETGSIRVRQIYVSESPLVENISSATRNAEVTRLFAEGFKGAKPLYRTDVESADLNFKVFTSYDQVSNNYYLWSVLPHNYFDYNLVLDLNQLQVKPASILTIKEVSENSFGEIVKQIKVPEDKIIKLTQPKESVWLIRVAKNQRKESLMVKASDYAQVTLGEKKNNNTQIILDDNNSTENKIKVRRDDSILSNNHISYLKFNLSEIDLNEIEEVVLNVYGVKKILEPDFKGHPYYGTEYTIRVYGIEDNNWSREMINANNAPNLYPQVSAVKDLDFRNRPVGHLTFTKEGNYSRIDLTDYLKEHKQEELTLIFIKEKRHVLDYNDQHYILLSVEDNEKPYLEIW